MHLQRQQSRVTGTNLTPDSRAGLEGDIPQATLWEAKQIEASRGLGLRRNQGCENQLRPERAPWGWAGREPSQPHFLESECTLLTLPSLRLSLERNPEARPRFHPPTHELLPSLQGFPQEDDCCAAVVAPGSSPASGNFCSLIHLSVGLVWAVRNDMCGAHTVGFRSLFPSRPQSLQSHGQ